MAGVSPLMDEEVDVEVRDRFGVGSSGLARVAMGRRPRWLAPAGVMPGGVKPWEQSGRCFDIRSQFSTRSHSTSPYTSFPNNSNDQRNKAFNSKSCRT